MRNRILILTFVTLLIGAVVYYFSFSREQQALKALDSAVDHPVDRAVSRAPVPLPPGSAVNDPAPPPSYDDPQFQTWLAQEARSLDGPSVDSEKKQIEMRKIAQKLKPSQGRHLRNTALAPTAPVGQRILSAYLLVEGGLATQEELRHLIQAPLQIPAGQAAHSEDEAKSAQEKSLRIMAIDGLATRAKTDPSAREALARAASESADSYIRSYAQRRLQQL